MLLIASITVLSAHLIPTLIASSLRSKVEGAFMTVSCTIWILATIMKGGDLGTVSFVVSALWGLRQAAEHHGDVETVRTLFLVEEGAILLSLVWLLCV